MPHKFNATRRDKIPKQKYRVTNWAEYNESLRRRGDLTMWISEDALALWAAPRRKTRGGQSRFSELAIEMCLTLGGRCCKDRPSADIDAVCSLQDSVDAAQVQRRSSRQYPEAKAPRDQLV